MTGINRVEPVVPLPELF